MEERIERQAARPIGRIRANTARRRKPRKKPTPAKAESLKCTVVSVLHTDEDAGKKLKNEIRIVRWNDGPPMLEKRCFYQRKDGVWKAMRARGFTHADMKILLQGGDRLQALLAGGQQAINVDLEMPARLTRLAANMGIAPKMFWAALLREKLDILLPWSRGDRPQSREVEDQFYKVSQLAAWGFEMYQDEYVEAFEESEASEPLDE